MTATLSTRLVIPRVSREPLEIEVDYVYNPRHQELCIEGAVYVVDKKQYPCWHLLTQSQRRVVEEDCRTDYADRMGQAVVDNARFRDGD